MAKRVEVPVDRGDRDVVELIEQIEHVQRGKPPAAGHEHATRLVRVSLVEAARSSLPRGGMLTLAVIGCILGIVYAPLQVIAACAVLAVLFAPVLAVHRR